MATSPIDLSAGLVPKAGGIDLSAGLVPKTAAPAEKSLWQKAKDNFNANTQGAKPGDGAIKGFVENVGQGGGQAIRALAHPLDTISGMGHMVAHPLDQAHADVSALNADPSRFIGNAVGQVGTGSILGEAAAPVARSVSEAVQGRISPDPIAGQNYTPAHAAAFEGALAPATAMGRNFIPQNLTPEALSPIRATAARMAQGTPVEQGIFKAVTSPSTPPLERVGAYQAIVKNALGDLEAQHAPALAQSADIPVDTAGIVKELRSKISATMAPADKAAIQELIDRTQNAKTIGDLNRFRRELNVETAPEYRQNQVQAGRSGLSSQATSDLSDFVRTAYYDNLQKATGTDFAPLKRQEANLINVQEALQNQQTPLAKAEATFQAPTTLREKAGNLANIVKDPKTGVTQTLLREAPAAKISFLLRKSLTDLPEPIPSAAEASQPFIGSPQLGIGQPPTIHGTPVDPFPSSGPPRLGNPQGTLPSDSSQGQIYGRAPSQLPSSTDGFNPSRSSPPPDFNPDTARMRVQPSQFNHSEIVPSRGTIAVSPSGEAYLPAKGLPAPEAASTAKAPAVTGKSLWAQKGAQKMEAHGVSASDIEALAGTAKGKQLLVIASDLTPGSAAMKNLVRQIPAVMGK